MINFVHLNTLDAAKKIRIGDVEMSPEGSDAEDAGTAQNLRYVRATWALSVDMLLIVNSSRNTQHVMWINPVQTKGQNAV